MLCAHIHFFYLSVLFYQFYQEAVGNQALLVKGVKQFVVTNCSKERPGSIVTETLKNRIFVPIVT